MIGLKLRIVRFDLLVIRSRFKHESDKLEFVWHDFVMVRLRASSNERRWGDHVEDRPCDDGKHSIAHAIGHMIDML